MHVEGQENKRNEQTHPFLASVMILRRMVLWWGLKTLAADLIESSMADEWGKPVNYPANRLLAFDGAQQIRRQAPSTSREGRFAPNLLEPSKNQEPVRRLPVSMLSMFYDLLWNRITIITIMMIKMIIIKICASCLYNGLQNCLLKVWVRITYQNVWNPKPQAGKYMCPSLVWGTAWNNSIPTLAIRNLEMMGK